MNAVPICICYFICFLNVNSLYRCKQSKKPTGLQYILKESLIISAFFLSFITLLLSFVNRFLLNKAHLVGLFSLGNFTISTNIHYFYFKYFMIRLFVNFFLKHCKVSIEKFLYLKIMLGFYYFIFGYNFIKIYNF